MNRVREMFDRVLTAMRGMTATQRWLVASLGVVAVMSLFLVAQYASRPAMVDLLADDPTSDTVQFLRAEGFRVNVEDGRVLIDPSDKRRAMASLATARRLPDDMTLYFDSLVEQYDWKAPREQNHQRYTLALQNELGRVITEFPAISKAKVIIDRPERGGLGRASTRPTAMVTVFGVYEGVLAQNTVDAIAALVAGAVSGLSPADVSVVDGLSGQSRSVTDAETQRSGAYIEHQKAIQDDKKKQIEDQLRYIPGVIVAVTAHTDVTRVRKSRTAHLEKGQGSVALLKSETGKTHTVTQATAGGEPGIRSNTEADLNAPTASGTLEDESNDATEFVTAVGSEITQTDDPRGMPTFVAATIQVPQDYVSELIARAAAAAATDDGEGAAPDDAEPTPPTDAEVAERFEAIRTMIEDAVRPHLKALGPDGQVVDGEVRVAMYARVGPGVPGGTLGGGGAFGTIGPSGGIAAYLGDSPVQTALVGVLAVVAGVLMLSLIRRSGRQLELPVAEDLVGIPPALQAEDDLIGEAGTSDSALEGVEIDENAMKGRQLLEQVSSMVQADPATASKLLSRWIEFGD